MKTFVFIPTERTNYTKYIGSEGGKEKLIFFSDRTNQFQALSSSAYNRNEISLMFFLKNFFETFSGKDEIKGNYLLALDIGTEFIKALILKINKRQKEGLVVGAASEPQSPGHMISGAVADIGGVVEACRRVIREARLSAGIRKIPHSFQAVLGIAGEFVRGAVATLTYERENARSRIDLAELKNIIQKIQWRALNKIRQELAEELDISEIEVKLINAAIVDIKIDGYRVVNPLGFQGKQFVVSIFNAYAPLVHLGALQSIVADLGLNLLFTAAEPYAIARAINLSKDQENREAIFIDMGGGTTDIAVVRQGGIEGMKSFALGGRAFTKRLAQLFDLGLREAEEIKLKYSRDEIGAAVKRKISKIFEQDIHLWLAGVHLTLEEFSQVNLLPAQIMLCGGASLLPGLKEALEAETWWEGLSFAQTPKVNFIKPEDVLHIKDITGQLMSPQNITPMALASLAVDLIQEENHLMKSILRRTLKLIQS